MLSRQSRCLWGMISGGMLWAVLGSVAVAQEPAPETPPVIPRLQIVAPEEVGVSGQHLQHIDAVVQGGLEDKRMPGCVVLIARRGKIVFLRAYGQRAVLPEAEPMTTDTIFDMASLTKPIATATSIMHLVETGQIRLRDRLSQYWPEFAQNGKETVTVQQLLTHTGGFIPDNADRDYLQGPHQALLNIFALTPQAPPGSKFIYSDVGFIVLGELVKQVTQKSLHEYSHEKIFRPLGMRDTGFLPRAELEPRIAPTEQRNGRWMRGQVHDPRAAYLGGVAGHAGLFSTAEDVAVYAQMLLERGSYHQTRILGARTVDTMTRTYPAGTALRGLGWDKLSNYSMNRGEFNSDRAFGHSGFTGTTLWVDPALELIVVVLSNRVHPDGKGLINPISGRIGTIAAAALLDPPLDVIAPPTPEVSRPAVSSEGNDSPPGQ